MKVIETIKDELLLRDRQIMELDLSTRERFLRMDESQKALIDRNRQAIQAVGLQVHKVEQIMGQEFLRVDRGLIAVNGLLEQYGNRIEAMKLEAKGFKQEAEKMTLQAERYGFEAHKLNADSKHLLEKADMVYQQHVNESRHLKNDALAILDKITLEGGTISNANQEAILKQKKALVLYERKENEIRTAMKELAVSNQGAEAVLKIKEENLKLGKEEIRMLIEQQKQYQREYNLSLEYEKKLESEVHKRRMTEQELQAEKQKARIYSERMKMKLDDTTQELNIQQRENRYLESTNNDYRNYISRELRR